MELTVYALIWLPIGLGLLGFVEPCSIGGHLVFLETQAGRDRVQRIGAALMFTVARSAVTGLFGALIAFLGQKLIAVQTSAWLLFGVVYFAIGVFFLTGKSGWLKWNIDLAPSGWKQVDNPVVLGLVLGLNIPACAAPILFGLLSLAATAGTALSGFVMMSLFGFALSLPLLAIAIAPKLGDLLNRFGQWLKRRAWLTGLIFVLLGVWSIWFGLYVDPANWSGK